MTDKTEIIIPGIKLISHNLAFVHEEDDLSYPWRLDVSFRAPEFLHVTIVALFGNEEISVCAKTESALRKFIEWNELDRRHPRFLRAHISRRQSL